jgi:multidrug efflux pump subunit AcrA (membrane-fusion protein)
MDETAPDSGFDARGRAERVPGVQTVADNTLIRLHLPRPRSLALASGALAALLLAGCSQAPQPTANSKAPAAASTVNVNRRLIRTNGIIRALEWQMIRVPQITGTGVRFTLTRITPNGIQVKKGDVLAEFDRTSILDDERDAKAKLSDQGHQLDDKRASVRSDAAKRLAAIKSAEADLEKASLELRKGPILSGIDKAKNEAKAANASERLTSLKKSDAFRKIAEEAAVRTLELKLERQRVVLERVENNLEKMQIHAPQDGMVALENSWRNGSMGPAREGDQLWPGMPLMRIFNPARMVVEAVVNEPDIAWLQKTTHAKITLDAYPGASFDAELQSSNPVATAGVDSPVRTFGAVFRIQQQDPRLLPDLSAALEIGPSGDAPGASGAAPASGGAR